MSSSETVPFSASGVLFGVLIDLKRVEIVQLVQAKQALFPQVAVVDLAFFEQQLAADDAVAGDGVALELDPRHGKGLALIDVDVQEDQVLGIIDARGRHRGEVDVAQRTIGLAQIIQTLADGGGIEPFPVLGGELSAQRFDVRHMRVAGEGDAAQAGSAAPLRPGYEYRCAYPGEGGR